MPAPASLPQIIESLRINWGERPWLADDQGQHRDWSDHTTVTYSFPTVVNDGWFYSEGDGLVPMFRIQQDAARLAFELWDDVVALNLTETSPNDGEITFAYSSTTDDRSYTQTFEEDFGTNLHEARIWLSSTWDTHDGLIEDLFFGSYGFYTYLHEIGHSLGLTHPGNYNADDAVAPTYRTDAEYSQDTRRYTAMSYFNADADGSGTDHVGSDGMSFAAAPLLHDIAAMQAIYGADMTTRTGNTVYGFNSTAGRTFDTIPPFFNDPFDFAQNPNPVIAIWDAGGNDTLDASGFATNQVIRLGEGEFSSIGALTNNVAIAFGARIENAVGGSGHDIISGNASSNRLDGGGGDDSLRGGGGDTLVGGRGNDYFFVTSGDWVSEDPGGGTDMVETQLATYTMSPNVENLVFTNLSDPTAGHRGNGNPSANTITGADGNDTFYGGSGNDALHGRGGSDTLHGGYHTDTLHGGAGNDTLNGDDHNDLLYGESHRDILNGGNGTDWLFGGADNDVLNGGPDNDLLVGGDGKDTMTGGSGADMFRFSSVGESSLRPLTGFLVIDTVDTIADFEHGVDRIDLSEIDANPGRAGDQAFNFLASPDAVLLDWTGQLWVTPGTTGAPYTPGGLPGSGGGPAYAFTPTVVYASTDADPEAEFQVELRWAPIVTASDFIL